MVTFTRTQLHEAVWSLPLNVIAKEHGVPYEEIVRACDLMRINRPRVGYWQIKSVMRDPPPPPPLTEAPGVPTETRLRLRIPRPKRPAEKNDESRTNTDHEHVAIASSRKALAKAKVDGQGFCVWPFGKRVLSVRVSPPQVERAIGIFALLIDALEMNGAKLEVSREDKHSSYETWVLVSGERFRIELVERLTFTDHEPKHSGAGYGHPWSSKEREYHLTGRLALRLRGLEGTGTRQRWEDTPTCPLEEKVAGIPVALVMAIEVTRARRVEQERQQRRREEEMRVAEEERRVAEVARKERLRQDALVSQALQMFRQWKAAREFSTFMAEVERVVPAKQRSEDFTEAMMLARMHLQDIDPLDSPERAVEVLTNPNQRKWAQEHGLGLERPTRRARYGG